MPKRPTVHRRHLTSALTCAALLLAGLAGAAPAHAVTTVFVQNNTPFAFTVAVQQTGASLRADAWQRGVASIAPGRREAVVRFNRDSGITGGQRFVFTTTLSRDGSGPLRLLQQLGGATVGSHLWQSLAGPGFADTWFDDRATHAATWSEGGVAMRVLYRAYFTGTDDDIEYVLQHAYPAEADPGVVSVLAYNVYLRPVALFKNGQSIRARLLPPQLRGYDAIVFSEAFDDAVRAELLAGLRPEYPHVTRILGKNRSVPQAAAERVVMNGGVIVVSRWPIKSEDQLPFGDACGGEDCLADKGVLYAKIDQPGRPVHLFASHTQAWQTPQGQAVRVRQFQMIKAFIDSKRIPAGEPVLIAGDLNVDRLRHPDWFADMLRLLNAECPPLRGLGSTWDPTTNSLAAAGQPEFLDFVLWSKAHQAPSEAVNEARLLRSAEEWKEFGFERAMWDLSDHYPLLGRLRFPDQFIGKFPGSTYFTRQILYAVKASGELLWYAHVVGQDANPPAEREVKGPAVTRPVDLPVVRDPAPRAGSAAVVTGRRLGDAIKQQPPASTGAVQPQVQPKVVEAMKAPVPHLIHQFEGPRVVGTGWQGFRTVIPAGQSGMYGLTPDGVLRWYRHDGFADGSVKWKGPVDVGTGWTGFTRIVAGGDGVLYAVAADGALRWYRHGDAADASARPSWSGPRQVGTGWGHFLHVFSAGEGVLYAVAPDGRLLWYRHKGYLTGTTEWEGPREIATGWTGFTRVFSSGEGVIYAIRPTGQLAWYRHDGHRDGSVRWLGPTEIASGWADFVHVFPRIWAASTSVVR